jgi:hypothetical protein
MKKKTRGRGENDAELLGRLSAGLSEGEIQRVLAGALKSLDHAGIDRLLKEVNSQTAATLRRVLHAKGAKHPVIPGKAKVQQEWDRAWEDWNSRIAEASDEEGQYVIQEHHWEEPYFDPGSLALDLEPIAVRMRKILARVIEENIDPDFSFADAVQESMEEIESGLPDRTSSRIGEIGTRLSLPSAVSPSQASPHCGSACSPSGGNLLLTKASNLRVILRTRTSRIGSTSWQTPPGRKRTRIPSAAGCASG